MKNLKFNYRKVPTIEQGEEMSLRNAAEVPQVWFAQGSTIKIFTVPAQSVSEKAYVAFFSTRMISKQK